MSGLSFRRLGGVYQLAFEHPDDLAQVDVLDEARWAATSVPIEQLHTDPAMLERLDTDGNRRLRVHELRAGRAWLWARLADRRRICAADPAERLRVNPASISVANAQGKALADLCRQVNAAQGRASEAELSLADLRAFRAGYMMTFPNGDGVVPPTHVIDAGPLAVLQAVVTATGGSLDHSGGVGVNAANIDAYLERVRATLDWRVKGVAEAAVIAPMGDDTAAALGLVDSLLPKLRRYFAQCRLLLVEAGAEARLTATPEQLGAIDVADPAAIDAYLRAAPLATPRPGGALHLDGALNPGDRAALRRLAEVVGPALLGRDGPLTELQSEDVDALLGALAPHRAHIAAQPAGVPADLEDGVLEAVFGDASVDALRQLCAADLEVADEVVQLHELETLLLYQGHLWQLFNNFVSFPDLFAPDRTPLFVRGALVIDGRRLNLCQRVVDKAAHRQLAVESRMFVIYVEATRRAGGVDHHEQLAVGVTAGTQGGIALGKRGVFYDRDGLEWDAVVTDLIVNPISLVEAMFAPFVRMRDAVMARIEGSANALAGSLEKDLNAKAASAELPLPPTGGAAATPTASPAPPAQKPADAGGNMQGMLIGGSLAFAAIGSSLAYVVKTVAETSALTIGLALGGLVLSLLAVSALLAWLKLRRRDLSALLEASGMALNARLYLSRYLASLFTLRPGLPPGAALHNDEPTGALEKTLLALFILALLLGLSFWMFGPEIMGFINGIAGGDPAVVEAAAAVPEVPPAAVAAP